MFGGDSSDSLSQISMMASTLPVLVPQQQQPAASQPQWSQEEMRELIRTRAELERDFSVSKRNKSLWEMVSGRMRDRGYRRTPEQCKCKWKNLLNRYKGSETSDLQNSRPCPFFDELHVLFSERGRKMQRLHLESERASSHTKGKSMTVTGDRLFGEPTEDEDEDEEEIDEERTVRGSSQKRKAEKPAMKKPTKSLGEVKAGGRGGDVCEVLKEFLEQQQRMEMEWREVMERRAHERLMSEQEWRQAMEKLERERLMVEQARREMEEQRRFREESRAERRDALLNILLNKLTHEDRV